MPSRPYLALIVVNYFGHAMVSGLLGSLRRLPGSELTRVCVVDNSQSQEELLALKRALCSINERDFLSLDCAAAPENLGYGRGNNFGYAHLKDLYGPPRVVVVANPDTRVESGSLRAILDETRDARVLMVARTAERGVASAGLFRIERLTGRTVAIESLEGNAAALVYPKGHFLIVPCTAWELVGGFSDDYFLYGEEIDLALSLESLLGSVRARVTSAISVSHERRGSTSNSTKTKSLVTLRESSRSRVVLYRRHARLRKWLIPLLATRVGYAAIQLARGHAKGCRAVLSGIRSGLCHSPSGLPISKNEEQ